MVERPVIQMKVMQLMSAMRVQHGAARLDDIQMMFLLCAQRVTSLTSINIAAFESEAMSLAT